MGEVRDAHTHGRSAEIADALGQVESGERVGKGMPLRSVLPLVEAVSLHGVHEFGETRAVR